MATDALADQCALVQGLRERLQARGDDVQLFETHISWVLVGRSEAYKIKKAVRLDFLDFSPLAARHVFCEEELRLNARMAPGLYKGVSAITGTAAWPELDGNGPVLEYAVRMDAFPQEALWSERIRHGLLTKQEIDQLARLLGGVHQTAERASVHGPWGSPVTIRRAGEENIEQLQSLAGQGEETRQLEALQLWRGKAERRLWHIFSERKQSGAVRECHGDLHCENILTRDGKVAAFDCIEFSAGLRWIDVLHDLAFPVMDLSQRGKKRLAARLVNGYLERTGDYTGLGALRYYHVEAALVRAKVALLRGSAGRDAAGSLVAQAWRAAHPPLPALFVMHGFSGSGKSTVARELAEMFGAIQLRSDVERKRMCGVDPFARSEGEPVPGLYEPTMTAAVYARLRKLAARILWAGYPAIIDAANLRRAERAAFAALADGLGIACVIVDVTASEGTMRYRIRQRLHDGADPSDADESVLGLQLRVHEPLAVDEQWCTVAVDSEAPFDAERVRKSVGRLWPEAMQA